jgi:hypothetical protein
MVGAKAGVLETAADAPQPALRNRDLRATDDAWRPARGLVLHVTLSNGIKRYRI